MLCKGIEDDISITTYADALISEAIADGGAVSGATVGGMKSDAVGEETLQQTVQGQGMLWEQEFLDNLGCSDGPHVQAQGTVESQSVPVQFVACMWER